MEKVMTFPALGIELTRPKTTLVALTLAMVMLFSGYACNAQQWVTILANDLPVLIQMASSIAQIVVQFGVNVDPSTQNAIQNIGNEAVRDAQLIQKLYSDYKANPTNSTRQDLEAALGTIVTNLPQLLEAAHIKDQALLDKVTSAVKLIVATANTILALMPNATSAAAQSARKKAPRIMTPDQIRQQWNQEVGVPLAGAQ